MCVCGWVYVCVCTDVHRHAEAREECQMVPLSFSALLLWDKVSHCTGRWLASKTLESSCPWPLVLMCQKGRVTRAFAVVAGDQTLTTKPSPQPQDFFWKSISSPTMLGLEAHILVISGLRRLKQNCHTLRLAWAMQWVSASLGYRIRLCFMKQKRKRTLHPSPYN